jgi:hypothetical protein
LSWIFAVVDGVGAFDLESDGLSGQGLNEDLHTTTETEDEMESRLLLDVVIGEGAAVFKLLSASFSLYWSSRAHSTSSRPSPARPTRAKIQDKDRQDPHRQKSIVFVKTLTDKTSTFFLSQSHASFSLCWSKGFLP